MIKGQDLYFVSPCLNFLSGLNISFTLGNKTRNGVLKIVTDGRTAI